MAAVTVAVTPLNLTVLLASVVLKPLPRSLTLVPPLPICGENSEMLSAPAALRRIATMLPTASYS